MRFRQCRAAFRYFLRIIRVVVLFGLWFCIEAELEAADLPEPWTELASDGTLSIRMIVPQGGACPTAIADGIALPMTPPVVSVDDDFRVLVCQAYARATTRSATVNGLPVPTVANLVQRVVVIGDTGCRLEEGDPPQPCNDPFLWPFATIARFASNKKPDLVIHVGDYFYREAACPENHPGCAGSPHRDTWLTWKLDFFDPAGPLLTTAPWVVVRGDHEVCEHGGRGWIRLLDPHPRLRDCVNTTEPYALTLPGLSLLIFDSSAADDPAIFRTYSAQLASLMTNVPSHTWLVTHQPVWALNQAGSITTSEQDAIRRHIPSTLDMVLSGHVHNFASYSFGPERPAQLVVGDSGDSLEGQQPPATGVNIDGQNIQKGFALPVAKFGYFLLDRVEGGWDGTLYGTDDAILARCRLRERDVECG